MDSTSTDKKQVWHIVPLKLFARRPFVDELEKLCLKEVPGAKGRVGKDDEGPQKACVATVNTLHDLYHMSWENGPSQEQWDAVRGNVKVSLIKDAGPYGSTSLSSGMAAVVFQATRKNWVRVLNNGSGGGRVSEAKKDAQTGIISVSEWAQPEKKEDIVSVHNTNCGHHVAKNAVPLPEERAKWLAEWDKHQDKSWWSRLFGGPPIFGGITGPTRDTYFDPGTTTEQKKRMDDDATYVFPNVHPLPGNDTLFITRRKEAGCEFAASNSMHGNLGAAAQIDPKTKIVCTLAIGGSSTQAGVDTEGNGLLLQVGMNNLPSLASLPKTFVDALRKDSAGQIFLRHCVAAKLAGRTPTVSPKAGGLLEIVKKLTEFCELFDKERAATSPMK